MNWKISARIKSIINLLRSSPLSNSIQVCNLLDSSSKRWIMKAKCSPNLKYKWEKKSIWMHKKRKRRRKRKRLIDQNRTQWKNSKWWTSNNSSSKRCTNNNKCSSCNSSKNRWRCRGEDLNRRSINGKWLNRSWKNKRLPYSVRPRKQPLLCNNNRRLWKQRRSS